MCPEYREFFFFINITEKQNFLDIFIVLKKGWKIRPKKRFNNITLKTAQNCVYEVFVYNEYILKVNKKSNHVVRILTCHSTRSSNIIDDCIDTN